MVTIYLDTAILDIIKRIVKEIYTSFPLEDVVMEGSVFSNINKLRYLHTSFACEDVVTNVLV